MTLNELLQVVQDQNYRLIVYDKQDRYTETVPFSRYQSMFRLTRKENEEAARKHDEILKAKNKVKFLHSADFYPDIGVQLL